MNSLPDIFQDIPLPLLNHWWYWIILFMAIAEALPLLGIFIPGQMIIIGWGFLAKIGILEIGDVLWVATLGAILGDLIGYLIGKRYGYTFLSKYGKYFFFKEIYLKKTQKLMQGHTGKTLIIGRFNSLTRAFSPFIAGASRNDKCYPKKGASIFCCPKGVANRSHWYKRIYYCCQRRNA